jgi:hypothetical protein
MPDTHRNLELMPSLGRLVRGLSALFWGLPITLLVCVKTGVSEWLRPLGLLPPVMATGLLLYGVWQMGYFQRQERVWHSALERAQLLAIINFGLSPFIFWWNRLPFETFYSWAVGALMLSGLLFVFNLNQVLQRLSAMLPDETLRAETQVFTSLNLYLLFFILALVGFYLALREISTLPLILHQTLVLLEFGRNWLLLFLFLLPLALTMTMIWKIKEVILASVFEEHQTR